nr:MAG TPA: hypothetical protein [Caudoviricetes sp.]
MKNGKNLSILAYLNLLKIALYCVIFYKHKRLYFSIFIYLIILYNILQ